MKTCPACHHVNAPQSTFCAGCGGRLADLPDDSSEADDLVGQTLAGRYLVEKKLGEGGMGAVYRAQDTRLQRKVALKALSPELVAHPTARRRMHQEADALARVEHLNVVRVFDVFDEEQRFVIVMELITGGDLSKRIQPGGLAPDVALPIFDGILAGLDAIHAAGLVHRDVKPENILLTQAGIPKVVDLGVARDEQARERTQLGARLGTPEYMSPEQAQGMPVDLRSDIYSAGLLLFELLSGDRPFSGASEFDLLAARVQRDPDLTGLRKKCAPALVEVVACALARDPAHRYPNASAFRQAVAAALKGGSQPANGRAAFAGPPSMPPTAVMPPMAPPPYKHPPPAVAQGRPPVPRSSSTGVVVVGVVVGGVLLLAAIGMAIASFNGYLSSQEPPVAAAPAMEAPPQAPEPVAEAPAAPTFYPNESACSWTMTAGSSWLLPDQQISGVLKGAGHPFRQVTGVRRSTSYIQIDGPTPFQVTVPGKYLLTVKSWTPWISPELEWVVGFWYDGSAVTVTFTRIVGTAYETKRIDLNPHAVTDERDGHYLWATADTDRSADNCLVNIGTDGGVATGRPNFSTYLTLPESAEKGWPTVVEDSWGRSGELH